MMEQILMKHSAEIGLVLFFVSFLLIGFFTVTRSRKELDRWASLPLSGSGGRDRDEPREME